MAYTTLPVRTPTLPPATHTNVYLLGDQVLTVVDPASPYPDEQARLLAHLQGLSGRVERVLLTHHHWDHVGGAQALATALDVPVAAHPRTAELLAGEVDVQELLRDGDRVETDRGGWTCLFTPGHASGHLCLQHDDGHAVVAGDMVAGEGTIVLDPPEGDLALYLASLARLRTLDAGVLLPAHGPPLTDPAAILDHYIRHRNGRTDQLREALRALNAATPLELAGRIYTELPPVFLGLAARQVLCHLQYLAARGEVCSSDGETWEVL